MPSYRERDELIPRLAHDLARQLEGHEPDPTLDDELRKVQALYRRRFEPITVEQFEALLRLVARGASVRRRSTRIGVAGSGIAPPILCRYLADPELLNHFNAAWRHWREYRGFGVLEIQEILQDLAHGDRSLQSCCYARGMNLLQYRRVLRLIARAPEIERLYHQAKRSQMTRIGERLFEEAAKVSTRKEARELSRRMDLIRRRMPTAIREVFCRERSPIEAARLRAGRRLNGKEKSP